MKDFILVSDIELRAIFGKGGDSGDSSDSSSSSSDSGISSDWWNPFSWSWAFSTDQWSIPSNAYDEPAEPTPPTKQTPINPNGPFCDILALNSAIDQGVQNPGTFDGNAKSVDEIFNEGYKDRVDSTPDAGAKGYAFFDWGSTPGAAKDHMEYVEISADGKSYTVWQTNEDSTKIAEIKTYQFSEDSNGKGGNASNMVFVPIQ